MWVFACIESSSRVAVCLQVAKVQYDDSGVPTFETVVTSGAKVESTGSLTLKIRTTSSSSAG